MRGKEKNIKKGCIKYEAKPSSEKFNWDEFFFDIEVTVGHMPPVKRWFIKLIIGVPIGLLLGYLIYLLMLPVLT